VYETVRASPAWNETALIIMYDEHGGYYDHVPTPLDGIPSPDGKVSMDPPFEFKRLGLRVPVVVISPWIDKNTVVHESVGPTPTSHYEHSSITATFNKIFGFPEHLTDRDRWAGTFENVFLNRKTPRTDCPWALPPAAKRTKSAAEEPAQPLNDLQKNLLGVAAALGGVSLDDYKIETEMEGGLFAAKFVYDYFQSHGHTLNKDLLKL